MRLDLGPGLDALKDGLMAQVDAEAEAVRLRFITPGTGQAMEYEATEREARRYVAATGPAAEFPFLEAERAAQGGAATLASVAAEVIAQADAWAVVGAEIKRLRRAAKLAIAAASSPVEARAAATVVWPAQ